MSTFVVPTVVTDQQLITVVDGFIPVPGPPGPVGPQGPEGGTTIVPVPYDQWPPQSPQPDVLYLRLVS